jgi:tRNA uridine 5-carboxymethylaminomethyl modification enzyme
VEKKQETIAKMMKYLNTESISPEEINDKLIQLGTPPLAQKVKLSSLLLRPQISIADIQMNVNSFSHFLSQFDSDIVGESTEETEILIKYGGYVEKEQILADKLGTLEEIFLQPDLDYFAIKSLSYEAREKLSRIKPKSIGQASRISGVSPSDISVLAVYIGR